MAELKLIENKYTGDKTYYYKLDVGTDVLIAEMPGFSSSIAYFGTRYGSVNNKFKTISDDDFIEVPEGIAHYLEHKLFENEDCGAFERYAKTGASANAYTSFDRTCYYYKCTDNFYDSLEILLDFVQKPYFTDETVAKEQGIIGQEIKMTNDDPEWRVFFDLLRNIFYKSPVKIDIAGTVESIAKINKELLYKCYNSFYNPGNMVLACAGNIDHEKVISYAEKYIRNEKDNKVISEFPVEPKEIVRKRSESIMEVGIPIFNIGFKCDIDEKTRARYEVIADIAFQLLTDKSFELYKDLAEKDLINSNFSYEFFSGHGYFVPLISGESIDPDAVNEAVIAEIKKIQDTGVDENLFEEIKRCAIGSLIKDSNIVDSVASKLILAGLDKRDPYYESNYLYELKAEDINKFLREKIDCEKSSLSIVKNKRNGDLA